MLEFIPFPALQSLGAIVARDFVLKNFSPNTIFLGDRIFIPTKFPIDAQGVFNHQLTMLKDGLNQVEGSRFVRAEWLEKIHLLAQHSPVVRNCLFVAIADNTTVEDFLTDLAVVLAQESENFKNMCFELNSKATLPPILLSQ